MREDLSHPIHRKQREDKLKIGEGSSSPRVSENVFRIYFKGVASEETLKGKKVVVIGIGVAICDLKDNLIFEVSKTVTGKNTNKVAVDTTALIEAFDKAIALNLEKIFFSSNYYPLFQFMKGEWRAKQQNITTLVEKARQLRKHFKFCHSRFLGKRDVKFASKLARDAIVCWKDSLRMCEICFEDYERSEIFSVEGCGHIYCFSCMKQYMEVKLLNGIVPKCPDPGCRYELLVDSCKKFLTPKLTQILLQLKLEASIPVALKVYCPYPRCSALMRKNEVFEYSRNLIYGSDQSGLRKCLKCDGLFCFNCKVPWHSGMTCNIYQSLNSNTPAEDLKLKFLASKNQWRQCSNCKHMIERKEGCSHMTCRCGFQFCYNCGAELQNNGLMCSCKFNWNINRTEIDDEDNSDDSY